MNQELIIKTLGKILKDVEFLMDAVINDYTPTEVVPAAYTQDFNNFYKAYGINKTKSQSFIKWKKLNNQQKSTIMDLIPLYHNAFLANNCWEDYMYLLEKKQQSEKTADKVAEAQKKRLDAYNY